MSSKNGFTLAEVLITLGVVGVVSALTLPTVIKNYKAIVLQQQFRKAYSSFSQAIQMILTNEFDNNVNMFENTDKMATDMVVYLQKYMRKSTICNRNQNCSTTIFPQTKNAGYSRYIQENYKTYNGYSNPAIGNISDTAISLQDGTFAIIDDGVYITIDINGWKKGPNRFGHDFFMFQIINGHLTPMGASGTKYNNASYCSADSDNSNNGRSCTVKALSEKDYFKNLPK